jgi:putative SOS response-associated peptidase YedK
VGHAVVEKLQAKGKTVDFKELLRMEPDSGTTKHPQREEQTLDPMARRREPCVVPLNSFSEFNKAEGGDICFALGVTRPLLCFAGIWTNWTSVRKVRKARPPMTSTHS